MYDDNYDFEFTSDYSTAVRDGNLFFLRKVRKARMREQGIRVGRQG